jgi:hypothetical protein
MTWIIVVLLAFLDNFTRRYATAIVLSIIMRGKQRTNVIA